MLSALSDGHRSTATFVSQLLHCVLIHHTSQPLSFLPALDATPSASKSLADLASALGPFQLAQLFALPSVRAALDAFNAASKPSPAGAPSAKAAMRMQHQLPAWLADQQMARQHRRTALLCVLELVSCLFPGANREVTSARAVYTELVSGRPARQWKSTVQALTKLRQLSAHEGTRLRAALKRCRDHLRAGAAPARAGASLEALLCPASAPASAADESAASIAPAPVAASAAPKRWSASKKRQMLLASAASGGRVGGGGAPHTGLSLGAAAWFEAELCSLIDAPSTLPLFELWQHEPREAGLLAAASSSSPTHALQAAMQSVLDTVSAKRGQPADAPSRVAGASVGDRWKRSRLSAKDRMVAEVPALKETGAGRGAEEAEGAPPANGRRRGAPSRTPASSAGTSGELPLGASGQHVLVCPGVPPTSGSTHGGWAAAALSDVLRSSEDKAMGALQAFEAFEAHALAARASERLGLERGALAARFVLAAQDLAMVGWLKLGSKASRGMLHKLAL
jgi:hypothetical protein